MLLFATSCLNIKLEDQFSDPDAITSVTTARELLSSAYNDLPRHQMELSVLADDFVPTVLSTKNADLLNLYKWQDKAISELSEFMWNEYYMTIAVVNALIPRLDYIEVEDEAEQLEVDKIRSEGLALKAMCYFDLIRLYAPVWSEANAEKNAIILKDKVEFSMNPRSTLRASIEEVMRLLDEALKVENTDASVFYLSTIAVKYLKAEVYLYQHEYQKAYDEIADYLEEGTIAWTKENYNSLWSANEAPDRIFAPHIFNTFYTDLSYDVDEGDYFSLSDQINFIDEDVRKEWAQFDFEVRGTKVRQLGKYNKMFYDKTPVRYINSLRYSGLNFIAAEALARDGKNSEAIKLMNSFLGAYGATLLDESLSGDELIDAILTEKQKEFAGEGERYFDLKRTGKSLKIMTDYGVAVQTEIKADDYRWLFPIPSNEYKYNDYINTEEDQNPGWPIIKTQ